LADSERYANWLRHASDGNRWHYENVWSLSISQLRWPKPDSTDNPVSSGGPRLTDYVLTHDVDQRNKYALVPCLIEYV